jgi:hypothetical protein
MNKRRKSIAEVEAEEEEENEENEDQRSGILKDGQSVRVSLFMRDGSTINPDLTPTQRAKALHQTQTEDAIARKYGLSDARQLHRPGFRRNTDAAALERSRAAYAAYDAADAVAYKHNQAGDTGEFAQAPPVGTYPLSAGEGSTCTVNGQDGVLVRQGNWLVCKPRQRQDTATFDAKASAYAEYDREMSNAWRTGK